MSSLEGRLSMEARVMVSKGEVLGARTGLKIFCSLCEEIVVVHDGWRVVFWSVVSWIDRDIYMLVQVLVQARDIQGWLR